MITLDPTKEKIIKAKIMYWIVYKKIVNVQEQQLVDIIIIISQVKNWQDVQGFQLFKVLSN